MLSITTTLPSSNRLLSQPSSTPSRSTTPHCSSGGRQSWLLIPKNSGGPLVYSSLSEASRQMLAILMGLNHIYHPGLKWLNHLIGEMQIAPPDLATRLKGIFFVEPLTAIQEARKLFLRQRRLFEQPPLY